MAYTDPTPADFKTRYPEFASVADGTVQVVIDEVKGDVGSGWIDADRRPAIMAMVGHLLASQGALNVYQTGAGATLQVSGPVDSVQVGDVRTSFASQTRTSSGAAGLSDSSNTLLSTPYGKRFAQLQRRSFPQALSI